MRPCPAPWKPCQTEDGELFYFNQETGDTLWDHPSDAYPKSPHQERGSQDNQQDLVSQVTGVSADVLAKRLSHFLTGVPMTPPQAEPPRPAKAEQQRQQFLPPWRAVKVEPPGVATAATQEELRYQNYQVKNEPRAGYEEDVPSSHFQARAASEQGQFMAEPVEPAREGVQARGSVAHFIAAPVEPPAVTPTKEMWQALTASRQARCMAMPVEPPAKESTISAQACKRPLPRPPWKDAKSLPPPPSSARLPQSPTRPPKRALPPPTLHAAGKQVKVTRFH